MARGEDTGNHPGRQVGRHVFEPPTGLRQKQPLMPPRAGTWQRTEQGGWKPSAKSVWSKPNPGGYTDDEMSNIMRDSGP